MNVNFSLRGKPKTQKSKPRTRNRLGVRFRLILLSSLGLFVGATCAQDAQPSPTEPLAQPTETPQGRGTPAPTASPTPEPQAPPALLPESKTLPAQPPEGPLPRDLIPEGMKPQLPGLLPNPSSAEQQEKDKIRFRQIRTIALRNPFAIYLAQRAKLEKTEEGKREYLRVYFTSMCDEMRKLEPRLKAVIDAYENGNLSRCSQVAIRPTIPLRDLSRYRAAYEAEKAH